MDFRYKNKMGRVYFLPIYDITGNAINIYDNPPCVQLKLLP